MKIFLGKDAPDDSYTVVGFRKNLDSICDDTECTDIVGPTILDYVPKAEHEQFILHLIRKLRRGGKLLLGGVDIISLALNTFNKTIPTADANNLIYGTQDEPSKSAITCLEDVRDVFMQNLKITKQTPGINFTIEGVRT